MIRFAMPIKGLLLLSVLFVLSSFDPVLLNRMDNPDLKDFKQSDSLIAPGAQLKLISSQFKFTEGPASDSKGNVFFTDQPNNRIWKYDLTGNLAVFMEPSGRSNGLYFDKNDNLYSCADEKNQLWKISPDKKVTVVLASVDGQLLNGPNDLWICPKGNIYFTDPLYERPYWETGSKHIPGEKLYLLKKGKTKPEVVDDQIVKPNGIIGTPDGKYLYVADIGDNKTYRYRINANGKLSDKQLFVSQGSDGMTIDNKGNIYLTGKGVTVYDKQGEKLMNIPVPANWTANVCFGGKDKNKLYITASESFYELEMNVRAAQ